ncbi:hypothetical protein M3Y98_01156800 [Aphelenchoides besseyi]|nr:hypothetical protein M3Y98_01152700 [Aphelenchoides besseyi]KAI6174133.1 hypothetical protein M3Y98_01156800 [Aphelenchoides besseyi]KAI6210777.1 hypothetical protein M3Y96_00364000 [Aphelenchoides besseyi]KAI6210834.1 hypothetical protein M3Y96_00370000 [Aphelenchoides besseyi]
MTDYRRYSNSTSSDAEEEVNDRCCFGRLRVFTLLPIITILNVFFDIGGICLTLHTDLFYGFCVMLCVSLLCLAAIISGVQEEKKWKIRVTMLCFGLKLTALALLLALIGISVYDHQFVVDIWHLNLDPTVNVLLLIFIPSQILFVILQFELSDRTIQLIAIRDELYVIPSIECPADWRSSLSVHLEKLDRLEKLRAQRPSLATVLAADKY